MFKINIFTLASFVLFTASCGGGESNDKAELREILGITQSVAQGGKCKLMGNSDYPGIMVNDCLSGLECYFDVCQSSSCDSDADCTSSFGSNATCEAYVLDGNPLGNWCRAAKKTSSGGSCDDGCLDNCTVGAACIAICC